MHLHPEIRALLERLHHPSLDLIMPGLERMRALLNALGNPEKNLPPVIHVAGTNGKGSVCAYLTAMLQQSGLRVHRYTSPHLVRFNERIMVADHEISDDLLHIYLSKVAAFSKTHPTTFFEATTAAAFLAFAEQAADVCILEVGLGGRLDATNVIDTPLLTIITPIAMDHMEYLGDTLEKIAFEKAGIMKPDVPCIIGAQKPEAFQKLQEIARIQHTPLRVYGEDWKLKNAAYISKTHAFEMQPSLPGLHQLVNASIALAAVEVLQHLQPEWPLALKAAAEALSHAAWPARLQHLHPPHPYATALPDATVWLDGGHNEHAAEALAAWLTAQPKPRSIILGMLKDKDAEHFIRHLQGNCEHMFCIDGFTEQPTHSKELLAHIATRLHIPVQTAASADQAVQMVATREQSGTMLICGSLYLAGKVLRAKCISQ